MLACKLSIYKTFYLIFNRLYKAFNLKEGFNYYFTLKQVITSEMITNFKLKIMFDYSRKRMFQNNSL